MRLRTSDFRERFFIVIFYVNRRLWSKRDPSQYYCKPLTGSGLLFCARGWFPVSSLTTFRHFRIYLHMEGNIKFYSPPTDLPY